MMIRMQIPPERYGPALESDQKAVRDRKDDVEDHNPANDPDVCLDNGDTEEEETDADFQCCCGESVGNFAEEPVLDIVHQCVIDELR